MPQKSLDASSEAKVRLQWMEAVDARKRAQLALGRADDAVARWEQRLLDGRGNESLGLSGQGIASAAMRLQDALARRKTAEEDMSTATLRHKRAWTAYKPFAEAGDDHLDAPWVAEPADPKPAPAAVIKAPRKAVKRRA